MTSRATTNDFDKPSRPAATAALSEDGDPDEVSELVRALGAKNWRDRQAAVTSLARRDGSETIGAVLRAMRDGHRDLSVLNSAIQVLAQTGIDTIAALREFLTGPDPDLRSYAATVLGAQNNPRAIPQLMSALDDPDPNVRYHVIEALGQLRAGAAVDALIAVAESRDFHLSFPALAALASIGDTRVAYRLMPLLDDPFLQTAAIETLGQLGDEEVVGPLTSLVNGNGDLAGAIAQALAVLHARYEESYCEGKFIASLAAQTITPAGVQALLARIEKASGFELKALAIVLGWLDGFEVERRLVQLLDNPDLRQDVGDSLARRGSRVVNLLIELLEADDGDTRRAAVLALGRIGDRTAVPALLAVLPPEYGMSVAVAGALAMIGDARAYSTLVELLCHSSAGTRQAVVSALNAIGHAGMSADMVVFLNDANPLVRESAVKIASYFAFPECSELLVDRCQDPDENVRRAAVECLPQRADDRSMAILLESLRDQSPGVRAAATRGLGKIDNPDAWRGLQSALDDPDPWVRYFAARSAGQLGCADAALALAALRRLAQDDGAMQVRVAAVESLGNGGGAEEIKLLAPLAEGSDDDLARAALTALGSIAHPDALPPMFTAASSDNPLRRVHAFRALAQNGMANASSMLRKAVSDLDLVVAQAAVKALVQLATPDAVDALVACTAVPSRRDACVAALAGLGAAHIAFIARGLEHECLDVRRSVVVALGRMKHVEASEQLRSALSDAEPSVRHAAIAVLAHAGNLTASGVVRVAHRGSR